MFLVLWPQAVIHNCIYFSPNWEKCAEVKGDITTGRVPDLIEGNQYEFRVRAVNKAGPGEPSDATKPHVARPKNCEYCVFICRNLFMLNSYTFEQLTSILRAFNLAFGFTVLNFPLNHCACLTVSVYIL